MATPDLERFPEVGDAAAEQPSARSAVAPLRREPGGGWAETASGFKFRSPAAEIQSLILKSGDVPGKAKVIAKGKGTGLPDDLPGVPLAQPVTVQLLNNDGECWEASYSAPATGNENDVFRDKSD